MNNEQTDWFLKSYETLLKEVGEDKYAQELLFTILPVMEKAYRQGEKLKKKDGVRLFFKILFAVPSVKVEGKIEKTDLLIWPVQFIHLDFILPVYAHLTKLGIRAIFVCERQELIKKINKYGIDCLEIRYKVKYGLARSNIRRMKSILNILTKCKKFDNTGEYFRTTFFRACDYFLTYEIYSDLAKSLFKESNPLYNLLGYELSVVCRPVQLESFKQNIKTGRIQQGAMNYVLLNYSNVDDLFVWDRVTMNTLSKMGKSVILTGPANRTGSKLEEINEELIAISNWTKKHDQAICLVAFSGPGYSVSIKGHISNIQILEEVVKEMPEVFFMIKLHPKDKMEFYNQLSGYDNVVIHKKSKQHVGDIYSYLRISDLILTGASTSAFEAWQQGKVVISIDLLNELEHMEFIQTDMTYSCSNKEELKTAIKSVILQDEVFVRKKKLIMDYKLEYDNLLVSDPVEKIAKHIGSYISDITKKG